VLLLWQTQRTIQKMTTKTEQVASTEEIDEFQVCDNEYSFIDPLFQKYITRIRKHKPQLNAYMSMADIGLVKLAAGLSSHSASLLNQFWIGEYIDEGSLNQEDIISGVSMVIHDIHKIFEVLEIESLVKCGDIPQTISLDFEYDEVKYLVQLLGCASLLNVISGDILSQICDDSIEVDCAQVVKSCSMCLAICSTILDYCGVCFKDVIAKKV
jgi:hypothetical protein